MSQDLQSRPKQPSRSKSSPRLDRAMKARTDPDDARFDRQRGEPLGRDILKNRFVSAVIQKLVGVNRPVPPFLKKYGIWIIDATFLAITWADHVFGIVESPWGSGILLLLLTFAVIV